MRVILLKICALLICFKVHAQAFESNYPKDYFRNPLNIPILLAGNFGECRPNHFHSGIDIKTNQQENLPVFATAEGYISRIKMEKGGFGHALYVTHPNGYTTLYAHLNDFIPPVQQYLKKVQYEKESWALDVALKPEQFPVKKGQQIAWSGNTGGSSAPHLHFEIRDSKTEHPLNPQLFGFPINDKRAPVAKQISLYDLNRSIYRQSPQIVSLKRSGNNYTADTVSVKTGRLGIGINADDFMDASENTLNFFTAAWYLDGTRQGAIVLDDIGYDVTRYLHAYIDHRLRKQNNQWYQLLFMLPGNMLKQIYPFLNYHRGAILLNDEQPREIKIVLTDVSGNDANVLFYARSSAPADTAGICEQLFKANQANSFEHTNVRFTLASPDLYDDVCFEFEKKPGQGFSERFKIHDPSVPVHQYFDLRIKPNKHIPFDMRNKMVLKYSDGKTENGKAAVFDSGWYMASVRNFGTYWLVADTAAPVIASMQKQGADLSKASRISFSVKEDITSVKKFRAELDGKWLAFEPRGDTFFYTFDERCPKGRHKLVVNASDENDNKRTLVFTFTR